MTKAAVCLVVAFEATQEKAYMTCAFTFPTKNRGQSKPPIEVIAEDASQVICPSFNPFVMVYTTFTVLYLFILNVHGTLITTY